jgi:hypothetical protein
MKRLNLFLAVSWHVAAHAADPARAMTVPPPDGFPIQSRHAVVAVTYGERSQESPALVQRAAIEKMCEAALRTQQTTFTPRFEEGADLPDRYESAVFVTHDGAMFADFSTRRAYGCDHASYKGHPCGCTYKTQYRRSIDIKRRTGDTLEQVRVDLVKGEGTRKTHRYTKPAQPPSSVIGKETIAGIECVKRRFELAAGGWAERCFVDDPQHRWPQLRDTQLSEAWFALDGGKPKPLLPFSWRADRVVPDAWADIGVFDPPRGVRIVDEASRREVRP